MRIVAGQTEGWQDYIVRDYNGNMIEFCSIVDTDQGYAECAFAVPSGFKTNDETLKSQPLYSRDENYNHTMHIYTLHTFELWNIATNTLVAKV